MDCISLYVHWPFCLSKCPYCDFNSYVEKSFDYTLWKELYQRELNYLKPYIAGKEVTSIFFGGGTPSLMSGKLVASIIETCSNLGRLQAGAEISLEANPNAFDRCKEFAECGVNRISIGMQSLDDNRLQYLGRSHRAPDALKAFEVACKFFKNISLDFIYATPGQCLDSWASELESILALKANHLSLYQLVIEGNTKFYSKLRAGKMTPLSQDEASELYDYTNERALVAGYERYEISNYADSIQSQCKHNLNYWNYGAYIGIGPGAHSRIKEKEKIYAVETYSNPKVWADSVLAKRHGIARKEPLNNFEQLAELLFMGLRTAYGVEIPRLQGLAGTYWDKMLPAIELFSKEGLAWQQRGNLFLTAKGMALHTEITYTLLDGVL